MRSVKSVVAQYYRSRGKHYTDAMMPVMKSLFIHAWGLGFGVGVARLCAGPPKTLPWYIKADLENQQRKLEETEAMLKELQKTHGV